MIELSIRDYNLQHNLQYQAYRITHPTIRTIRLPMNPPFLSTPSSQHSHALTPTALLHTNSLMSYTMLPSHLLLHLHPRHLASLTPHLLHIPKRHRRHKRCRLVRLVALGVEFIHLLKRQALSLVNPSDLISTTLSSNHNATTSTTYMAQTKKPQIKQKEPHTKNTLAPRLALPAPGLTM